MVNGNCAVVSCKNSNYRLKKWKKDQCSEHSGQIHLDCPCPVPFSLHRFPSKLLNANWRKEWIRSMNRVTKRKSEWNPGESDMVCSIHFVDGKPTLENPNPTLNLGYEKPAKKPRRMLNRPEFTVKSQKLDSEEAGPSDEVNLIPPCQGNLHKIAEEGCQNCEDKDKEIESLSERIHSLSLERDVLEGKCSILSEKLSNFKPKRNPFSLNNIKTDKKMKFYTGIETIGIFNVVFNLISPFLTGIVYWRGKKQIVSTGIKKTKTARSQKVCCKDQFLLVLMRLRLGLFNQDLADRFHISESVCSNIFVTWVKLLGKILGDALVVWLPRDVILANLPSMFLDKHKKTRCIIDCSEVYIERPKSLDAQAATWSDYKKHNTLKFLIGISPTGFIMFISDSYGGRTSDRHICKDSKFYSLLEPGDEIMADRGFQIKEDLLYYHCALSVPPGARAKSQMTESECKKTKEVANLRIHVERAINRIKEFKILKSIVPINMLPLSDDIIKTCAALCNFQRPLIKKQ